MNMLTREEYKTYVKLRNKVLACHKGTQTEELSERAQPQMILIQNVLPPPPLYEDPYEEYEEEHDSESETETSEPEPTPKPTKKRKLVRYFDDEVKYFNTLSTKRKNEIDNMEQSIMELNYTNIPIRFRVLESDMDLNLKALAISKINQLNQLDPSSGEYGKLNTWIEHLCKLPIGKYKKLPVDSSKGIDAITKFLDKTKANLDAKVFGHNDTKNQIIRLLAKWIANPDSKGLVIGIEGAMGIGKTTLCNGICESLGLPFGFVPLGGVTDGNYLLGHSYTYEGARWGRIADILMKLGCMNPVIYFDELDKISATNYGDEIVNILIHLTDSSQNDKFHDKYFSDVKFDLSKCLIVFSYNHAENINPILRDRMVTIKADGYNNKDKLKIMRDYMLPQILKEFSFSPDDIVISDEVISYIISVTQEEEGVRNLKRSLEEIISQINLHKLMKKRLEGGQKDEGIELAFPLTLTNSIVDKFVKKKTKNISLPMMYI
jgi:ATP-dependent Lon protease